MTVLNIIIIVLVSIINVLTVVMLWSLCQVSGWYNHKLEERELEECHKNVKVDVTGKIIGENKQ